jgi:hypothetical protein
MVADLAVPGGIQTRVSMSLGWLADTDVRVIGTHARRGLARFGPAGQGAARHGTGFTNRGWLAAISVQGADTHARLGRARPGRAWQGLAPHGTARRGKARDRSGDWQASRFKPSTPTHGSARQGAARLGMARRGEARHGMARDLPTLTRGEQK